MWLLTCVDAHNNQFRPFRRVNFVRFVCRLLADEDTMCFVEYLIDIYQLLSLDLYAKAYRHEYQIVIHMEVVKHPIHSKL